MKAEIGVRSGTVVLMAKVSGSEPSKLIKKVMIEVLNSVAEEKRYGNRGDSLYRRIFVKKYRN